MPTDLSRARIKPYAHQVVGVEALVETVDHRVGRVFPNAFALFDEMGAGKTKQVIDAVCALFLQRQINRVLVIAPASVRSVWWDPELGEISKHTWLGIPIRVTEYHAKKKTWTRDIDPATAFKEKFGMLEWVITNYDFVRRLARREQLDPFCTPTTMLVLDESAAVKNHRAEQTKACWHFRQQCGRVVLLNGTPIANNPLDLYSQARLMHPGILGCQSFFHFRSRYALMGGFQQKQVIGWQNLEDLQKRLAPYVLRRLKTDCLDLPAKLPPTALVATLSDETWGLYKEMRDEFIAWLDNATLSTAPQAGVKALRLSQLVNGFIGGVRSEHASEVVDPVRTVGREKLDLFLEWYAERLENEPKLKLLLWCRFRPELARVFSELQQRFPHVSLGKIWGGQVPEERDQALRLLDPRTSPDAPVVVVGTPSSGALGLNLSAAHDVVYLSNDYSLKTRLQSEDRVHRPGQVSPVSYFDVVAVGPQGQRTIDHLIIKALRSKNDVATWTTAAWKQALKEE